MDIRTYRGRSLQEALQCVRRDLGPDAAVLHTREVRRGLFKRLFGRREIEVAASACFAVPSRMEQIAARAEPTAIPGQNAPADRSDEAAAVPPVHLDADYRSRYRDDFRRQMQGQLEQLTSMIEKLCEQKGITAREDLPDAVFRVFTDMIEADVQEDLAQELIERVRRDAEVSELLDPATVKARAVRLLEREIQVTGPIRTESGRRRLVALVGPTGVGKTTTIAKLAANFRLREKKRVGLITVDTYRIAAVEQLRTYADIIDLPMEVVATPRQMREAVERLADLDLVLMDTAGRSPRDEIKIQELRALLAEAEPDEVFLVLSSTASGRQLVNTARQFNEAGTTALLLTKLDEATGAGHLLTLLRDCRLPVSYLTDGQNVPDDIQVAEREGFAQMLLGVQLIGASRPGISAGTIRY
jgi:flagellar biosynthesis protein FlhF